MELENESLQEILYGIKNIHSLDDTRRFLGTLLTDNEQKTVLRRMAAGRLLNKGKTYKEIRIMLEISRRGISFAKDIIEGRGYGKNPNRKKERPAIKLAPKQKSEPLFKRRYKGAKSIF